MIIKKDKEWIVTKCANCAQIYSWAPDFFRMRKYFTEVEKCAQCGHLNLHTEVK